MDAMYVMGALHLSPVGTFIAFPAAGAGPTNYRPQAQNIAPSKTKARTKTAFVTLRNSATRLQEALQPACQEALQPACHEALQPAYLKLCSTEEFWRKSVADATDAARIASDIVLTEPGLSVIISVVLTSRAIFQRMKNYTIYDVSITIRIVRGNAAGSCDSINDTDTNSNISPTGSEDFRKSNSCNSSEATQDHKKVAIRDVFKNYKNLLLALIYLCQTSNVISSFTVTCILCINIIRYACDSIERTALSLHGKQLLWFHH